MKTNNNPRLSMSNSYYNNM